MHKLSCIEAFLTLSTLRSATNIGAKYFASIDDFHRRYAGYFGPKHINIYTGVPGGDESRSSGRRRELDERKKILERYERRRRELSVKPQSVRSFMIRRHRQSRLVDNVERLRRVNPRLVKGLGKVIEDYRNYRITYPKTKKIIEERLRQAGLEWKD